MPAILEVQGLTKHFPITHGFPKRVTGCLKAVDGVDFTVQPGETFGLVETGPTEAIFRAPAHPYTQALLAAIPKPEVGPWEGALLQGEPPRPDALPSGCRFRLRCRYAQDDPCAHVEPVLTEVAQGHRVACHVASRTVDIVPAHAVTY